LSPLNFSIFKFDAVLKILKFWLVPDESGVDPEVVDIGSSWPIYIISNAWITTEDSSIIQQAAHH
jgi:hypothetical protein